MTTELPVDIPVTPEGLTPEWLTVLLRTHGHDVEVTSVGHTPVGTGQMAGSFRLTPTYTQPNALPPTLIAKLATGPSEQRAFASGAFRNEVRFYRELAARFDVPVPACHAATISPSGREFVLLLDDLADARQGDQIVGCSPAQARSVALAAAGLHGPGWNDDSLVAAFPLPTDDDREVMDSVLEPMAAVYTDRFGPQARARAAVDWMVRHAADWLVAPTENAALIHGDLRIDNVLFGADGHVTVIDWQTITTGNPLRDIAFLLSTSLSTADRRTHERSIVADYHRALLEFGVTGYTSEHCWRDYVDNLIQAPMIVVFGAAAAQPTERGNAMFTTMLDRAAIAVDDLVPGGLSG
ncbi:phosphotransferase [Gordonia sp. ABSL1-1]|uniref:phosphotransferase family protein n=1 Tax=Gordonia sp. ABSL1-1 TaxID=3053923 RepID=UPI0025727953|nr:phosphotransferase [Gordonia sp. ABSL1-1]MDL9937861.1 phosphotransferase [Gordonia sp. ABSL1-1]